MTAAEPMVVTPQRRRYGTLLAIAALDLVAHAYLEHKTKWIASNLECRVVDDTVMMALNGHKLYTGPAETVDTARAELQARLSIEADPSHLMFSRGGYVSVGVDRMTDFWKRHLAPHVIQWLGASLGADSDDAAHCAMEIVGLVGHRRWMAYADASTNVRAGISLPWTPCLVAASRNTDLDLFVRDCAALVIRSALDTVDASCGSRIHEMPRRRKPSVVCGGLRAVYIAPGQWDLARGLNYKSRGVPPVDNECMAQMLASSREGLPLKDLGIYVDGHMHACIGWPTTYINITLPQTRIDRDANRTKALVSAATLSQNATYIHDFAAIESAVNEAVAARHANGTLDLWAPPDVSCITGLREALHKEDSARLRLSVGDVWDAAVPSSCIACVDHEFGADADGTWRDGLGAPVSWDDLVKLASVKNRHESAFVEIMPDKRCIELRLAQDDPCYAPDFAYRLCCDALAGDCRAIDWLGVLGLASSAWAMLDTTVLRVLSWLDDGAPSDVDCEWREPLIDWVLNVEPGDDITAHFAAAEDAFNREALHVITASGQRVSRAYCFCARQTGTEAAQTDSNDGGSASGAARCNGICEWRRLERVASFVAGQARPDYTTTYRGAVTALLTRTPLTVSARHIFAVDAICPLLGNCSQGVEALVRALHTCEPLRKGIIAPAQLALAERALSTPLK
nr:hypothetical protein [Pandoravirus aubagnensis]